MGEKPEWQMKAMKAQQNFCDQLGDRTWDGFAKTNEMFLLKQKIGVSMCGSVEKEPDEKNNVSGYTKEQDEQIEAVYKLVLQYNNDRDKVVVAFIFVCLSKGNTDIAIVPLIRVKGSEGNLFIDWDFRVYSNFEDYITNNTLTGGWICVPTDGMYTEKKEGKEYIVSLSYCQTPDMTATGKLKYVGDVASTATSITTGITGAIGGIMCFTPLAPIGLIIVTTSAIVGAPGAVYGTARGIGRLVDRGTHDQSISLLDREARGCWIGLAAATFSLAAGGSAAFLRSTAAAGNLVGQAGRVAITTLNVTTVTVGGIAVLNSAYELSQKENVTTLDVLQFSTSLFFFTNSLVSFKTASGIIKDAQKTTLNQMRSDLSGADNRQKFNSALDNTREIGGRTRQMHGNAIFIKGVKRIDDKNAFFQAFAGDSRIRFLNDSQININGELTVGPMKFLQIDEATRVAILERTKALSENRITRADFDAHFEQSCKTLRIAFDRTVSDTRQQICDHFGVRSMSEITVNGKQIFKNVTDAEVMRMKSVFTEAGNHFDKDLIGLGTEFASKQRCTTVSEYTSCVEFAIRKFSEERAQNMDTLRGQNPPGMKLKDFSHAETMKRFKSTEQGWNPDKIQEMHAKFEVAKSRANLENQKGTPKFTNPSAAANHYDKHGNDFAKVPDVGKLSEEQYFAMAREITGKNIDRGSAMLTQDGSATVISYRDPTNGSVAIKYEKVADGSAIIASLMYDKRVHQITLTPI